MFDAVTSGDAARPYERLGWVRVGEIPGYALMPRGGLCSTTFYHRNRDGPSAKASQVIDNGHPDL